MSIFKSNACKICLGTLRLLGHFFTMLRFRSSEERKGLGQKTVGTVKKTGHFSAKLCLHGRCWMCVSNYSDLARLKQPTTVSFWHGKKNFFFFQFYYVIWKGIHAWLGGTFSYLTELFLSEQWYWCKQVIKHSCISEVGVTTLRPC